MRILVIGSGGREHALTWKLRESLRMEEIYCAPGNAGIAQEAECVPVDVSSPAALLELANLLKADLTVVGPEAPLVAGVVDEFERAGRRVIGPSKAAARLEGSKIFAKEFMMRHGIPTARFVVADSFERAIDALSAFRCPVVIKADGLAAGKGVVIAQSVDEAAHVLDEFMRRKTLEAAGERVVIEECLAGEEISFIVLTDGQGGIDLVPTQDHKRLLDGDAGPNTGGMGAYSDDAILSQAEREQIVACVVRPTLQGLASEGIPYRGFLYCGLMMTPGGPQVLEYNVRLGDPETQPIMMRLRSDLVDLLLAARDGTLGSVEAHWTPNPSVCVVLTSAGYPGKPETGREITGYEAAETIGGVKVFHAGTTVKDHKLLNTGGRVMGVTAVGEDLPAAIQRAYAAAEKIQFEGMHYRHDIGLRGLRKNTVPSQAHDVPLRVDPQFPTSAKPQ
ncbi:MAG TPA: phosphoribosylamine--glycine ligase [Terriglobia bacterium]|jgi:phosphoribosylamine--glycine ligase|nr:phosphoribosylamine--glycine ligase [Terriglobia bacterium]